MNPIGGRPIRGSRRWSSGSIFVGLSRDSDSEGCQINYIGGLSNEPYRRVIQ